MKSKLKYLRSANKISLKSKTNLNFNKHFETNLVLNLL